MYNSAKPFKAIKRMLMSLQITKHIYLHISRRLSKHHWCLREHREIFFIKRYFEEKFLCSTKCLRLNLKLEKTSKWTWDYPICWPWVFFFLIPPWWSTLPFPNSYPWTMNIKAVFVKGKINPFKYWDKIIAWLKSKERSTRLQSAVKWKGEQWVI